MLGAAWMVGALTALEEVHGLDARDADVVLGTSAGSLLVALLGAGVSVTELRAHQLGEPASTGPLSRLDWDYETATGGSTPPRPRPRLGPGSTRLVRQGRAVLRHLPPTAVLAALAPEGRGSLGTVGALVRDVQTAVGADPEGWSPNPGVRAVAMDYDSGRRVVFGAEGAPEVALADAVMASCAIPGWYTPMVLHDVRYVDGGACSATNVDVLAGVDVTGGRRLDEVFVLAPLVSFAMDHPSDVLTRMERAWRARVTRRCLREVAKLHAVGTEATVLGPGPADLEAIGPNLMALDRRHTVLATAVESSREALADPEALADLPSRSPVVP